MVNRIHIGEFIESLRNTDDYIQHIYTKGGCYKFHLLLKKLYKGCTPYISQRKDHIITLHEGKYYDIYGEVSHVEGFTKLTKEELDLVNQIQGREEFGESRHAVEAQRLQRTRSS